MSNSVFIALIVAVSMLAIFLVVRKDNKCIKRGGHTVGRDMLCVKDGLILE